MKQPDTPVEEDDMTADLRELAARARAVLDANWTGAATRPGPGLYPYQWSWDAGFVAIGYARYDQARAETELRSLFRGQWSNGLLPHIVFAPEEGGYFPGPGFWQTERSPYAPRRPRTSGIVQPPWECQRFRPHSAGLKWPHPRTASANPE